MNYPVVEEIMNNCCPVYSLLLYITHHVKLLKFIFIKIFFLNRTYQYTKSLANKIEEVNKDKASTQTPM